MDVRDIDPGRARAAALLRRATLGPTRARVDEFADRSWDDGVDVLLDADSIAAHSIRLSSQTSEWQDLLGWWTDQINSPDNGIVDKMMWFWHGHLTTNAHKVGNTELLRRQMGLLRSHALGNYRAMLQDFVVDGALLLYLDGAGSRAHNPNENLGRELMELFTIGRENHDQDDVRAAARALAGWVVDDEDQADPKVVFRREASFNGPLIFLGDQDRWDTEGIVDRLCDHPATAARISAALTWELTGSELTDDDAADLGAWWQGHDLEILPLVDRILRSDEARTGRYVRPRTGFEWFAAARAAIGFDIDNPWQLQRLGQMPFLPPNVGGWPRGEHWLRPGSLLGRSGVSHDLDYDRVLDIGGTTDDVLRACVIESISEPTRQALDDVNLIPELHDDERARIRWRLALNAPEFHLS